MSNQNVPPGKKRNTQKNNNNNVENNIENQKGNDSKQQSVDESVIKNLPLRTIKAGADTYQGYYDEKNLFIYLADQNGNLTGQRGRITKPLPPLKNDDEFEEEHDSIEDKIKNQAKQVFDAANKRVETAMSEINTKKHQKSLSKNTNDEYYSNNTKSKKTHSFSKVFVLLLVIGLIVAGIFAGIKFLNLQSVPSTSLAPKEGEIMVIEIKNDIIPGNEITEDMIQACNIDSQTYNQIAINGNDLYRWEQRDNIIGMFATEYISSGHYVTTNSVTKTYKPPVNPWGNQPDSMDYVDIPIDISQMDRAKLLIGAKVNIHFETSQKEDNTSQTLTTEILGATVSTEQSIQTTNSFTINNAVIANILTATNKNLFEEYSALSAIPEGNQEHYLKQAAKYNKEYVTSLTPTKIRVYLDKSYADELSKSIANEKTITVELLDVADTSDTNKQQFYDTQLILMGNILNILN